MRWQETSEARSAKREWNNRFIENVHKISIILPEFIGKNNRFSAFMIMQDRYIAATSWVAHAKPL